MALGKGPLCRVPGKALGEEFLFFLFFLPHFFKAFSHYLKLPVQIWDNFAYFKFELQVHEIMEFGDSKNDIHDIWCMLRPYPGTHMKCRSSC